MEVYRDISENIVESKSVVTIGNFDGVHLGHQEILKSVKRNAKSLFASSVVLSFYPSPAMMINPEKFQGHIDLDSEKIDKVAYQKIDKFVLLEFNDKIKNMSAEDFLKNIIIKKLKPVLIIVGYDHRFGFNREGDFKFLENNKSKYGYELLKINEKFLNDEKLSSSKIRLLLNNRDVNSVSKILGQPFEINGKVSKGRGIGKTIGFPTANIALSHLKILPGDGVYFVKIYNHDNECHDGMCNIGVNPTISLDSKKTCEVHIFNFNQNIYSETLKIHFIEFIRMEKKFKDINCLKKQLIKDKNKCLEYSYNNV